MVDLDYFSMSHVKPLPMDFWHIQKAFRKDDCEFKYTVSVDTDNRKWTCSVQHHKAKLEPRLQPIGRHRQTV